MPTSRILKGVRSSRQSSVLIECESHRRSLNFPQNIDIERLGIETNDVMCMQGNAVREFASR